MTRACLSREEIEVLCILFAASVGDCPPAAFAERLGLSPSLAPVVLACIRPLVRHGLLELADDNICLARAGKDALRSRLRELGIALDR